MLEKEIEAMFTEWYTGGMQLVGRQIQLPSGRADILFYNPMWHQFVVVECKKDCIKESTIGQVTRYKNDIDALVNKVWMSIHGTMHYGQYPKTVTICVGTSIDQDALKHISQDCQAILLGTEGFYYVEEEPKTGFVDERLSKFLINLEDGLIRNSIFISTEEIFSELKHNLHFNEINHNLPTFELWKRK